MVSGAHDLLRRLVSRSVVALHCYLTHHRRDRSFRFLDAGRLALAQHRHALGRPPLLELIDVDSSIPVRLKATTATLANRTEWRGAGR